MERAIIQKEWIKSRRVFLLCLILTAAMAVYAVLRVNRLIELKGADHLWLIMLLKDQSFADPVKWTSLVSAIAIALAQMLPEISQKRLKLTLHLPYPQMRMMLTMLLFGLAELLIICLVQSAIIGVYDSMVLPGRLVSRTLLTILPWQLAGFVAYLLTASICIEGRRSRRLVIGLAGAVLVWAFFEQSAMEAYNSMIITSLVAIVALLALPLGSMLRFKEGHQD